jgi:hypothetical protein
MIVDTDERPMDTNMEKMGRSVHSQMARSPPATPRDQRCRRGGSGDVRLKAKELGLQPILEIKGFPPADSIRHMGWTGSRRAHRLEKPA